MLLLNLGVLFYVLRTHHVAKVADKHVPIAEGIEEHEHKVYVDEDIFDEKVLERKASFDDRIARIKDELASRQNTRIEENVAQELHPLVKNLPHNTIRDEFVGVPDVEYAD